MPDPTAGSASPSRFHFNLCHSKSTTIRHFGSLGCCLVEEFRHLPNCHRGLHVCTVSFNTVGNQCQCALHASQYQYLSVINMRALAQIAARSWAIKHAPYDFICIKTKVCSPCPTSKFPAFTTPRQRGVIALSNAPSTVAARRLGRSGPSPATPMCGARHATLPGAAAAHTLAAGNTRTASAT